MRRGDAMRTSKELSAFGGASTASGFVGGTGGGTTTAGGAAVDAGGGSDGSVPSRRTNIRNAESTNPDSRQISLALADPPPPPPPLPAGRSLNNSRSSSRERGDGNKRHASAPQCRTSPRNRRQSSNSTKGSKLSGSTRKTYSAPRVLSKSDALADAPLPPPPPPPPPKGSPRFSAAAPPPMAPQMAELAPPPSPPRATLAAITKVAPPRMTSATLKPTPTQTGASPVASSSIEPANIEERGSVAQNIDIIHQHIGTDGVSEDQVNTEQQKQNINPHDTIELVQNRATAPSPTQDHYYYHDPQPQQESFEIVANGSSAGQSTASSAGWLTTLLDWGPRAEKRPNGGPPVSSSVNRGGWKRRRGDNARRWLGGGIAGSGSASESVDGSAVVSGSHKSPGRKSRLFGTKSRRKKNGGRGGPETHDDGMVEHPYYRDGMMVPRVVEGEGMNAQLNFNEMSFVQSTPEGGNYTLAEQARRYRELAEEKRRLEQLRQQQYHYQQTPGGEDGITHHKYRASNQHLYHSSSDSVLSFDEVEWTPQDSAYGAACPICGWLPKHIRRAIEVGFAALLVAGAMFFIVTTSIRLTNDHARNKKNKHDKGSVTNGGSGKWDNEYLLDDDFYIEETDDLIDDDDYLSNRWSRNYDDDDDDVFYGADDDKDDDNDDGRRNLRQGQIIGSNFRKTESLMPSRDRYWLARWLWEKEDETTLF